MEYIETIWEKRNLGVESCKFIIHQNENIDDIKEEIQNCNKKYQEICLDTGNMQLIWELQKIGFFFAELMLELAVDVRRKELHIPEKLERQINTISYEIATESELDVIYQEIESGKIFLTDKIALNPRFGRHIAGKRYSYWIQDELANRSQCFSIKYKGKLIGFEVVKMENTCAELLVGGIFDRQGTAGLGLLMGCARVPYWTSQHISKIVTNVSSNNINALKTLEAVGFKVSSAKYILIKQL
jgi:hypothetical protein